MGTAQRFSHLDSGKEALKFSKDLKEVAALGKTKTGENGYSGQELAILDSVTAINESISGSGDVKVPEKLAAFIDELDNKDRVKVVAGILDGINTYEAAHGQAVPPDVIEEMCRTAHEWSRDGLLNRLRQAGLSVNIKGYLDDATSTSPDAGSLQANRAVIAIQSLMSSAIPFASYLPTDIGSGEAKLIIIGHTAGSTFGEYAEDASMDGVNSGQRYFDSCRTDTATYSLVTTVGHHDGQLTTIQLDSDHCETVANGAAAVKLVKGSFTVYINGHSVAETSRSNNDVTQSVTGSVTLSGTTHAIGGTINTDTGVYALTTTPTINSGIDVVVEGFIDYNKQPELIPALKTNAVKYSFFANTRRSKAQVNIDATMQFRQETGIDPLSELNRAMNIGLANENHYKALAYARRLAKSNTATWDMSLWLDTGAQTRAQNIVDISIPLAVVSQQMAIDTNVTGVTHLYVGKTIKSWLQSLIAGGRFVPSGLPTSPQIHRIGRLDDLYEVYYAPDQPETTDGNGVTTAEILCIGQAPDVARSGIIMGNAVSPLMLPIGTTADLTQGVGYFEKSFMQPNKHVPSAKSFATITLTGLK